MQISQLRIKSRQRGQGMTEYIIIVALIAVSAIGVYSLFGQTIRNQTSGLAQEMSGGNAQTDITNAQTNAGDARTNGNKKKDMGTYNDNNNGAMQK
ncbi:MAG: pilus assembly protein [Paraburkholderia sp.]|uniref:Flp family type IVb pilin n=1 Tax=Paraburkholderia sp. TaxID=1926495 RepID=UPI001219398B|nr:pilus assembly protein [Paraburkholderia sp.]TAL98981.1 MAG: pilus assembly protein [Paraburkholderia sp.]